MIAHILLLLLTILFAIEYIIDALGLNTTINFFDTLSAIIMVIIMALPPLYSLVYVVYKLSSFFHIKIIIGG